MISAQLHFLSSTKQFNRNALLIANTYLQGTQKRFKSDNEKNCCKDVDEKKLVETKPKSEEGDSVYKCEKEALPPNYDPYRIKVQEISVPPLPPSNAKPMLQCAKFKSPCLPAVHHEPPVSYQRPPKKFPWIYIAALASFFSLMGVIYRLYLWNLETTQDEAKSVSWQARRKVKRPYHPSDLPPCVQYLIIGSGIAGWSAYRAIIEHDKKAKVFMITKDDVLPYKLPPLNKHAWWNRNPPDLKHLRYTDGGVSKTMYFADCDHYMDPVKFYNAKEGPAMSIASGWCVMSLDADDHVVHVKTNIGTQPIYYERCLLATGSRPKQLHMFKSAPRKIRDKVCTLRTLRDFEKAFRRLQLSKHVTIIGGGTLGTELAFYLGRLNKTVDRPMDMPPLEITQIIKDKGVLAGIIPEYLGEWAVEKIRCEGVQVIPKAQVYDVNLTPDERLELTLSTGEKVVTDFVFTAVGNKPRTELSETADLEVDEENGGYLVNTELEARTHLYVAGDAASFYSQWKGTRLRMEHYDNAEEMGFIAGANMTGYWMPCNFEPHFEVRLEDELQVQVVGEVGACMPTIGLFKPCLDDEGKDPEEKNESNAEGDRPCYKKTPEYKNRYRRGLLFYLRDETIVGVVFWNIPGADDRRLVVQEILRAKPSYKDLNVVAELLGFGDAKCVYKKEEINKQVVTDTCVSITNRRYED